MALPTPAGYRRFASSAPHPDLVWRGRDFLLAGGSLPQHGADRRRRRRSFALSLGAQAVLMLLMVAALAVGPPVVQVRLQAAPLEVLTYLTPLPPLRIPVRVKTTPPPRTPPPQPPPSPPPPVKSPAVARLAPAAARPLPAPRHAAPDPDPPPAPVLKRTLPAPLPAPETKVEVGRFGAPAGLAPHPGVPVPVPELGSFGATRTAPVTAPPSESVELGASGFNRTASGGGGTNPLRGGVRAAGFSTGAAAGPAEDNGPGGAVSLDHFAGVRPVVAAEIPPPPPAAAADFVPPEVLSWPTPAYTAEAAAHRVEGEVTLEARLGADGAVQVLRVLTHLGYGLDASATAAARQLKFRPARRHGQPIDWTVVLHVDFRMAY